MKISQNNLSRQHALIKSEVMAAFERIFDQNSFIMNKDVKTFEEDFSAFCKVPHAISCGNGTDAISIGLKALGVGQGDIVVTVANTFIATAEAILNVGAKVDFVDVLEDTMLMSPALLDKKLSELAKAGRKAKAVMPVHLYGHPCDMPEIMAVAQRHGALVFEDCAQAHGATVEGKPVGSFGEMGTFSFYPGKNLGALGDAGAMITKNATLAAALAMTRDHGRTDKYLHEIIGYNSRMDSIQAAVLSIKLKHLAEWTDKRRMVAKVYASQLADADIKLPVELAECKHVYHQYPIRVPHRDALKAKLDAKGISCGVHYPIPLHLQPALRFLGYKEGDFPVSELASNQVLSLPMDAHLKDDEIKFITDSIKTSLG